MKTVSRRSFLAAGAAAGAAAITGCVAPLQNPPLDPRIYVADNLRGQVVVTDVRLAPGDSDHLTFQATLQNITRSVLPVKYRVIWVDKEGVEVETALSTWQLVSIMPKDITPLRAVSPRPDVTNFRCYIQWGRS